MPAAQGAQTVDSAAAYLPVAQALQMVVGKAGLAGVKITKK